MPPIKRSQPRPRGNRWCKSCRKTVQDFKRHNRRVHIKKNWAYECARCGHFENILDKNLFIRHLRTHQQLGGQPLQPEGCIAYVPEGYETPVSCRSLGCGHKARSAFHLGIHAAQVHKVEQYFMASRMTASPASNPASLEMTPQTSNPASLGMPSQTSNPAALVMTPQAINPASQVTAQALNTASLVMTMQAYNPTSLMIMPQASNSASLRMVPQATACPIFLTSCQPQNVLLPLGSAFPLISSPPPQPLPVLDVNDVESTLSEPTAPYAGVLAEETLSASEQEIPVTSTLPFVSMEPTTTDTRSLDEKIDSYRESLIEHGVLSPMTEKISQLTIQDGKIQNQVRSYNDICCRISNVQSLKIDGSIFEGEEKVSNITV